MRLFDEGLLASTAKSNETKDKSAFQLEERQRPRVKVQMIFFRLDGKDTLDTTALSHGFISSPFLESAVQSISSTDDCGWLVRT